MSEQTITKNCKKTCITVAIYGGNGFVGTRVSKYLSEQNVSTVALSRTGHKPLHLNKSKWSEAIRWCKGEASQPDKELLSSTDVLILLVGSPPLPAFSEEGYQQQVFMNGTTNVNAIKAAASVGVKRVILLGARIPWPLKTDKFGYAHGKRLAFEAARDFAAISDQHSASVLKPGGIYGKRHLKNGRIIPLDYFMAPLSKIMPWQFVSVETVARRIANIVMESGTGTFDVIENRDI